MTAANTSFSLFPELPILERSIAGYLNEDILPADVREISKSMFAVQECIMSLFAYKRAARMCMCACVNVRACICTHVLRFFIGVRLTLNLLRDRVCVGVCVCTYVSDLCILTKYICT